jgi:leucyl aminopeptidase
MDITFSTLNIPSNAVVVFTIGENLRLSKQLESLDAESGGAIKKAIEADEFTGKKGKVLSVLGIVNADVARVVLVGLGDSEKGVKTELDIQKLGGKIFSTLSGVRAKEATVIVEETIGGFAPEFVASNLAFGAKLRSYRFDKYFTKKKDSEKPTLTQITYALDNNVEATKRFEVQDAIAEGVFFTRDVVSEVPNVLYPESYAEKCKELKELGIKVEVLGEKEMTKLGMGSLLSVGQGSDKESKLVVMQWNGAPKNSGAPVAFIGKGVTFDTGGISLKPGLNMHEMKYDMGGSGTVVGLMKALAGRNARVNAVGVIGCVENMPSGGACRPGDVVTSMSGQTIENLNTDAEGRLVLADALWYTQDRFKPKFMIDLATLTGAMVVALGTHRAGTFSNNDELAERIYKVGEDTGDRVWRLPMGEEYNKQMNSKVADMQNIGNAKGAGSITAAQFLERFVNDVPWCHIDIAGVCWASEADDMTPEGARGYGVRLLDKLVSDYYEA